MTRSLYLPYKPLELTLSQVDLWLERFPKGASPADSGKSQSQRDKLLVFTATSSKTKMETF